MKVLIVSTNLSHPTDAGNRAAIMGQVQILKHLGCDVHFLFVDMALKETDESQMKDYWGENYHVFHLNLFRKVRRVITDQVRTHLCNGYWRCDDHYAFGLDEFVNHLNNKLHFEAIIIQYMRLSRLLPNISIPRKAIYTHDVFSYKDKRVGAPFYETCNAHEEAKALQRCPNIFAIQEEEASYFNYLAPQSTIYTVYSHFDFHNQTLSNNKNILYLASRMEFNVNGIQWFLDNVWHSLISREPNARLLVAGTVCEKIPSNKYTNVELLGRVNSLDEFYKKGDIVINPVSQGTGLKIKTFEALSYGKTTIVHPHSTQGIFKKETAPLLIAKDPADWINYISDIFDGRILTTDLQNKSKIYINEMNQYIISQYKTFLT